VQGPGTDFLGRDPEESVNFPKSSAAPQPSKRPLATSGRLDQIVFLLCFRNHRDRKLPDKSVYDAILNSEGGHPDYAPGGSALDYVREVSYDRISIYTTIVDWIDLPETEKYYAAGVEGRA
jgi:hypothetical protein